MTQPNPSTAQARAIADELHRHGVEYAIISPGSRSAAMAIALDEHPGIETRVVLDERSAAFHALGRARVSGSPTVASCTSGTALANYLPAVVEADLSLVPLIVISADRPPELLHIGANQTIDQVRIFGEKTRWFCDLAVADSTRDWNAYWRSTVSQAAARATGVGSRPGPVHLNIAFREPTVPVGDDGRSTAGPYSFSIGGRSHGARWQDHHRAPVGPADLPSVGGRHGLLVAGEGDFDPAALKAAADRLRWPIVGTAASGLRGSNVIDSYHHLLVDGVPPGLRPEMVVTVGRIGPSDRLAALTALETPQVHLDRWGSWDDPRRHSTHVIQADPAATLDGMVPAADDGLVAAWVEADTTMRAALDERISADQEPTGPSVARALGGLEFDRLVVASSMPVRDVDAHTVHRAMVFSNRGASGIDGFVSMALGVASAGGRALALAGDLSVLHDAAGFVSDRLPGLTLVVIDNGGGGLFDLLPQSDHAPGFERLFVAPHRLDLSRLGEAYGLASFVADGIDPMSRMVAESLESGETRLVVVPVDRETDLKQRRALDDTARSVCAGFS